MKETKSLSQDLLHNVGGYIGSDEAYTPAYGVLPILKYVEKIAFMNFVSKRHYVTTVWCPFDTEDSEFVKLISTIKYVKVVHSHIEEGKDFFAYEPDVWHIIVSNPPFKGRREIFERALSFGKPIALLMTNAWLNDAYSKKVFMEANRQMQLLMFDKRIKFSNPDGRPNNKITFSSSYYCCDFLPRDLITEEINERD